MYIIPMRYHLDEGRPWVSLTDPRIDRRPLDREHEAEIERGVTKGFEAIRIDWSPEHVDEFLTPEHAQAVKGLFRYGYRHAKRLYAGHDPYEVSFAFHTIEKEADAVLKEAAEFGYGKLVVHFIKRSLRVETKLILPRD